MNQEPLRVLLVDDDDDCRLMVRDAIAECTPRHEICEARSGREAIEFLRKARSDPSVPKPGLIFLDIEMPGGPDGQAVLKAIRSDPALRDIPIVMMTGVSDEDQMRQAAINGANSYTIKPVDAAEFLRTVTASANYWLRIHQSPSGHLPAAACRR
jgi:two-component system response regulator